MTVRFVRWCLWYLLAVTVIRVAFEIQTDGTVWWSWQRILNAAIVIVGMDIYKHKTPSI